MARHVMLDNVNHAGLRVRRFHGPGSGHDVNLARVFPVEFRRLLAEYPLFFVKNAETGQFEPVALFGFEQGENLFLGPDGWETDAIPLTIERQPFLIGFQQRDEGATPEHVPVVHVDLDHPAVSESEGEPVFLPQGGETPFLQRITSVLMAIHDGREALRSLSQSLVGLELIESVDIDLTFRDGSRQALKGLYVVNEEKLAGLGGGALEALHRKGHLVDVYMMLASLPRLERLIARKERRLAA